MHMANKRAAITRLSEKQKECLRLVQHNYSSKEIGRKLGISQYAVDQRLRIAMRELEATSRFAAARILSSLEHTDKQNQTYQSMIYATPHLQSNYQQANQDRSDTKRDQVSDSHSSMLHDAQASFSLRETTATDLWSPSLVSVGRESLGTLSVQAKLVWVLAITAASLFAFGAAVAGLEVLSRFQ
jgi:DNA-binding CsgD family transcriptional regulator